MTTLEVTMAASAAKDHRKDSSSSSDSDSDSERAAKVVPGGPGAVTYITTQPGQHGMLPTNVTQTWMVRPVIPGCPPGLEYLTQIDQLIIKQEVSLVEVFLNWEKNNKFRVFNSMGQQVYYVEEDASCAQRQFCGPSRGFKLKVYDNNNQEVLRFKREFVCCIGCCWCANSDHCAYQMEVCLPGGEKIGHVRQSKSCWKPRIAAQTADKTTIGMFGGPCCVCKCPCCGDVEFPMIANDEVTEIGKISKQWSGLAKEWFTDADNFSVTFPVDMDVKAKATVLGTAFVVDMMYFEHSS